MKHGRITIHFQHYWHCGSGQAGEGDVDLLPVVENCGLPYVPGRALRGRLKWAARELGWEAELDAMFGREDAHNLDSMGRLNVSNATMRDTFAEEWRKDFAKVGKIQPMVPALYEDIASTSLKKGVAEAKTLRRVRYAVPVTVIADVSLEENETATWANLKKLVGELHAIGKGKHDGFGWCCAELTENEAGASPAEPGDASAYDLELTLLDDVVLSANSATEGAHRTLDHVPGSALMGAFARVFFPALRQKHNGNAEEIGAETLLTGKISFGNGVPIGSGNAATVPVPLSWHHAKDKKASVEGLLLKTDDEGKPVISNLAAKEYKDSALNGKQPVQMREGWLDTKAGRLIPVPRTQTLKTAIDDSVAKYETAKESALYGYEAIQKGTRLVGRIEVQDADADICASLLKAFDGTTIRLGRSKGTEFGRAKCMLTARNKEDTKAPAGTIVLLAESDLALLDNNGFPTLEPRPQHFGLKDKVPNTAEDGWELCRGRSFLRFRRYSLWNAKRGRPDIERQVISKGSVLVFTGGASSDKLETRVGLGQAEGLGRVRIVEDWMGTESNEHPAFAEHGALHPCRMPDTNTPVHNADLNLPVWIKDRHHEKQFDISASKLARQWSDEWRRVARRKGASISASQWGRLDEAARDSADKVELVDKKLGKPDEKNKDTIFGHGRKRQEWRKGVANIILQSLAGETDDRLALAAFRAACHRMAADIRRERH